MTESRDAAARVVRLLEVRVVHLKGHLAESVQGEAKEIYFGVKGVGYLGHHKNLGPEGEPLLQSRKQSSDYAS